MQPSELARRIEANLADTRAHVHEWSGGGDHFQVLVVSPLFEGKPSLARHRLVMALFRDEIASGEVHALAIKTFTPDQWEGARGQFGL